MTLPNEIYDYSFEKDLPNGMTTTVELSKAVYSFNKYINKEQETLNDKTGEREGLLCTTHSPEEELERQEYYGKDLQPLDIINYYDLNFNEGNVLKYLMRAGKKPGNSALSDYKKAQFYLEQPNGFHSHMEIDKIPQAFFDKTDTVVGLYITALVRRNDKKSDKDDLALALEEMAAVKSVVKLFINQLSLGEK